VSLCPLPNLRERDRKADTCAVGAGFPLFASAMYTKLGVGWASSLLGFLGLLFVPIPFVLYKYGGTLRKNHSKYARKDI